MSKYVGSLFAGDCVPHPVELVVNVFDLLLDFRSDEVGVSSSLALSLFHLGLDKVKALIDIVTDNKEPVSTIGLGF